MAEDTTYNGWTNWETWNLYNWLSSYPETWQPAVNVAKSGPDALRQWYEGQIERDAATWGQASWVTDVINQALHAVNW